MDFGISGKTAVVFGASRSLGKAAAQSLAAEGCHVVVASRSIEPLQKVAAEIEAAGYRASAMTVDIMSKESIARLMAEVREKVGHPDIVIYNNAGPADHAFDQSTDQDFYDSYTSQVMGFVWTVQEVVDEMKARGWGRFVTLGSIAGKEPHRDLPMVLHNIGRPAALGLSKTLSNSLAGHGITLNTIGTGVIDGGEGGSYRRTYAELGEKLGKTFEEIEPKLIKRAVPAGRAGRADELGALCAYLCSDQAGFLTGQFIMLDGGTVRTLL